MGRRSGDGRFVRAAALIGSLLAMAPAGARAQLGAGSGPIDISADSSSYENATCTSVWSGAAEVLQGDSRLRANVITAYFQKKPTPPRAPAKAPAAGDAALSGAGAGAGCGPTQRIVADGDVFYVTPTQNARADHAVYTAADAAIVMTGNVIVVQGKDVIHGDKMTIHTATHQVVVDSLAKGRGTPGRVRGVFYPGQPGQPGLAGLAGADSGPGAAPPPASP